MYYKVYQSLIQDMVCEGKKNSICLNHLTSVSFFHNCLQIEFVQYTTGEIFIARNLSTEPHFRRSELLLLMLLVDGVVTWQRGSDSIHLTLMRLTSESCGFSLVSSTATTLSCLFE